MSIEPVVSSALDALTAHIAILDEEGTILSVNAAWRRFARRGGLRLPDDGVGANYLKLCCTDKADEGAAVRDGILMVLRGVCEDFQCEYPCHAPDQKRWFIVRITRFAENGQIRAVVAHEEVTGRHMIEQQLRHETLHDKLTGLPNRSLFADRVARAIERSKRNPNYLYAVLFVDLDRFKVINDSLGHAAGDKLLLMAAELLQRCTRGTDSVSRIDAPGTVARMGGDEFTLLLEDLRSPEDAAVVANRILTELKQTREYEGHKIQSTASIGIVIGGPHYDRSQDLLRDADVAMYKAKAAGKAQYVLFDSSMHAAALSRLQLEADLRKAVEQDDLLLHYQPIISLENSQTIAVEALLRWRRNGQIAGPGEIITIAEDTGLIIPIGRWVLRTACTQVAQWQRQHPSLKDLSVSVNLSRRQIADPQLLDDLRVILAESGLSPQLLKLEITESLLTSDTGAAANVLRQIQQMGVQLYLDDFGTGYSSLSCLHQFPIEGLKIDRAFIHTASNRRDYVAVIDAIVSLARNLNIKVVAEGLETVEQVAMLQSLACDYGQGYVFSRPLAAEVVERQLLCSPNFNQSRSIAVPA